VLLNPGQFFLQLVPVVFQALQFFFGGKELAERKATAAIATT